MFSIQVKENHFPKSLVPYFPVLPKPKPREDFLTPEEYSKVLDELPDELKPLFVVSYYSGARRSELHVYDGPEVDMKAGFILFRETKNDEPREVPFIGPMRETLRGSTSEVSRCRVCFRAGR